MAGIPENNHYFSKIWPSMTSGDLNIDLNKKNVQNYFE